MEHLMTIAGEVLGILFTALLIYIGTQLKNLVIKKTESIDNEELRLMIDSFVKSVEQTLKKDDPTGTIRLAEVKRLLVEAGVSVTDIVESMIEAAVYEINMNGK